MIGRFTARRVAAPDPVAAEPLPAMEAVAWSVFPDEAAAEPVLQASNPLLTDKLLTAAEEDSDFSVAAAQWSIIVNGEVKPGESASFASRSGVDDEGWTAFQANRKYLYSFLTLSYASEGSEHPGETLTEMCVWFQNGDIRTVNECQSGHNQVRESGN